MFNLEWAKEVERLDLAYPNPKSINCFLIMSTITKRSNSKEHNIDYIVDFFKITNANLKGICEYYATNPREKY